MVKRIDLFMPIGGDYGMWHYITLQLYQALQRQGASCRLLEAKRTDPASFIKALTDDRPDFTLSINGLLPDDQGRFLCDMIGIPHVAFLLDSQNQFLPLTQSPLSIVSCIDRAMVDFFKGIHFNNALFTPAGADKDLSYDPQGKRMYDVVMLSSFIDYEAIRSSWSKKFPVAVRAAMEEAAEEALHNYLTPYYLTFVQAVDRQLRKGANINPETLNYVDILNEIELFIKGKDRVELVRAIDEAKVDIFGIVEGIEGWRKYLGKKSNVHIHDAVPFTQAIEIMKHTKILLSSTPWIKYGADERIFTAIACGALVMTNENLYLREHFQEGKSILFYESNDWDSANHRINEYLASQPKREQVAANGRAIVMKHHTWDHRAQELLNQLSERTERK